MKLIKNSAFLMLPGIASDKNNIPLFNIIMQPVTCQGAECVY